MSQESQATSVPWEILSSNDETFIDELLKVDELYFSRDLPDSVSIESDDSFNYESDLDSEIENEIGALLDHSDVDKREYLVQEKFKTDTCKCNFFNGQPCILGINFTTILDHRDMCREMSREELDLVIKAELISHRRSGEHTTAKRHKVKERERPHQEYFLYGHRVCRTTFCFAHSVEKKKLQAIGRSLDQEGLKARTHKNAGCKPANSLTFIDRERIKTFICSYARDNALPLPGRLPNFRNSNVLLLPSDKSESDIHGLYEEVASEVEYRSVSLRTFQRLWHDLCPHVTIMQPCTDLCQKCQVYSHKISNSGGLSEEEKQNIIEEYNMHVTLAKEQRDYYRTQVNDSKDKFANLDENYKKSGNVPGSIETKLHYSWDYAQTVHYPHHALQTSPIYFKTPRKCHVFGMCCEASGKQTFYLIDEAESQGKGPKFVHHYFRTYGYGEKDVCVHFDNCGGQNKNNVVLWYGMWRVIVGLHRTLEYSMMIAGHTKFEPDWHFGIWKMKWRNSSAETMEQIAETVDNSSRSGHNVHQLISDGDNSVTFHDWKTYLKQFFKPLKHISHFHHFLVSCDQPGVVFCKENATSEQLMFNLLKNKSILPSINDSVNALSVKSLDPARQWYLYEHIRDHCLQDESKDKTCPKPCVPKAEIKLDSKHKSKE